MVMLQFTLIYTLISNIARDSLQRASVEPIVSI